MIELRSRDLLDFIQGPVTTTRNRIFALLEDWQKQMSEESGTPREWHAWIELTEILISLLAQIVWVSAGTDLYQPKPEECPICGRTGEHICPESL